MKKIKNIQNHFEVIDITKGHSGKIHPSMGEFLGYCLYKLAIRFRSNMDQGFAKHHLLAPQAGMLTLLQKSGSMTQVELGSYLAIDKATMVRFLDDLENKKLLVRKPHISDKRAKVLELTSKGQQVIKEIHKIRKEIENKTLSSLTKAEISQFKKLISKLIIE